MKKMISSLLLAALAGTMLAGAAELPSPAHTFDPYTIMGRTDLDINQKFKSDTVYYNVNNQRMLFLDVNVPDQKNPTGDLYETYPNCIYQYNLADSEMIKEKDVVYISLDELKRVYGYGTKIENDTFCYKYNDYLFYDPSNGTNPTQVWKEDVVGTYEIIVSGLKSGAKKLTVSKQNVKTGEAASVNTIKLNNAVLQKNGKLYVPYNEFAEKAWGMTVLTEGDFVAVRKVASEEPHLFAEARLAQMNMCLNDDKYASTGNRWFVYYNESINKLMPYQVYVPAHYDPAVPSKFILVLHGGSGNENAVLSRVAEQSGIAIEPYADAYNYMLLLPNAIISSSWGDRTNDDPDTQAVIYASEKGVYASMLNCFQNYNIDTDKLFVQGNSMGSAGTIYFATNNTRFRDECGWTYEFKAAAPAGGNGFKEQVNIPMMWIWGERDGFAGRVDGYTSKWSEHYRDISTVAVIEHGHHSWAHAGTMIKCVYEFFDSVLDGTHGQEAPYVKADFTAGSNIARVTDKNGTVSDFEMSHEAFLSGYNNDIVMVSLSDLNRIFGIKAYPVADNPKIGWNFYGTVDFNINNGQGLRTYRNTVVLIYGNKTANIEMGRNQFGGGTTTYEGNGMTEIRTCVFNGAGTTFLRNPDFSEGVLPTAPIGEGSEIYVPVDAVLSAFGIQ